MYFRFRDDQCTSCIYLHYQSAFLALLRRIILNLLISWNRLTTSAQSWHCGGAFSPHLYEVYLLREVNWIPKRNSVIPFRGLLVTSYCPGWTFNRNSTNLCGDAQLAHNSFKFETERFGPRLKDRLSMAVSNALIEDLGQAPDYITCEAFHAGRPTRSCVKLKSWENCGLEVPFAPKLNRLIQAAIHAQPQMIQGRRTEKSPTDLQSRAIDTGVEVSKSSSWQKHLLPSHKPCAVNYDVDIRL